MQSIVSISQPKERRQKRKHKKDQNAPKKGMTAFLHFVQQKKDKYKEENPDLTHKQVISKLGAQWKIMTEDEKETYNEKAKIDKERYETAKKEYEVVKKQQQMKEQEFLRQQEIVKQQEQLKQLQQFQQHQQQQQQQLFNQGMLYSVFPQISGMNMYQPPHQYYPQDQLLNGMGSLISELQSNQNNPMNQQINSQMQQPQHLNAFQPQQQMPQFTQQSLPLNVSQPPNQQTNQPNPQQFQNQEQSLNRPQQ